MLHFFRSKAYDLRRIKGKWQDVVLEHIQPVLIGDHIKVSKEARHMPGVKKLHQDSEKQGKQSIYSGTIMVCWGYLQREKRINASQWTLNYRMESPA